MAVLVRALSLLALFSAGRAACDMCGGKTLLSARKVAKTCKKDGQELEDADKVAVCAAKGGTLSDLTCGDLESRLKMMTDAMCKQLEPVMVMYSIRCCEGATVTRPLCADGKELTPDATASQDCHKPDGSEVNDAGESDKVCTEKGGAGAKRTPVTCGTMEAYLHMKSGTAYVVTDVQYEQYKPYFAPKCCKDKPTTTTVVAAANSGAQRTRTATRGVTAAFALTLFLTGFTPSWRRW